MSTSEVSKWRSGSPESSVGSPPGTAGGDRPSSVVAPLQASRQISNSQRSDRSSVARGTSVSTSTARAALGVIPPNSLNDDDSSGSSTDSDHDSSASEASNQHENCPDTAGRMLARTSSQSNITSDHEQGDGHAVATLSALSETKNSTSSQSKRKYTADAPVGGVHRIEKKAVNEKEPAEEEKALNVKHNLYTFQKRSLRHSRQNWKAAPDLQNAVTLPKADAALAQILNRLVGSKRFHPAPQVEAKKKKMENDVSSGEPLQVAAVPGEAANDETGSHHSRSTPPPLPPRSTSTRRRTDSGMSSEELRTCVIPDGQAPQGHSRPPSQMLLREVLTPPNTASQLLSRNLVPLELPSSAHDDSAFNTTLVSSTGGMGSGLGLGGTFTSISANSTQHQAMWRSSMPDPFHQHGSNAANTSVIGSIRPNSVLKLPPIAVSTSASCPPTTLDSLSPVQKRKQRGSVAARAEVSKKPPLHHATSPASQQLTSAMEPVVLDALSDPEEVCGEGHGHGMFQVVPATVFPPFDYADGPVVGAMPVLVAQGSSLSVPNATKQGSKGRIKPSESVLSGTPQRLRTFGLRNSQSDENQPPLLHHRGGSDTVNSTAASLQLNGHRSNPASTANVKDHKRRAASQDAVSRVWSVCRWGYDVRSFFLVQLARDGLSLPRFALQSNEPLEVWLNWLQYGSSLEDVMLTLSGSHQATGVVASKTRLEEMNWLSTCRVVKIACEYIASTLFKGHSNASSKFAHMSGDTKQSTANQPSPTGLAPPVGVPFDGSKRALIRRIMSEQGIRIVEFCNIFREQLQVSWREAESTVKQWLEDPRICHTGIESCVRQFLEHVEKLRDHFIDCLTWNAEERHVYESFDRVVEDILLTAHPGDDVDDAQTAETVDWNQSRVNSRSGALVVRRGTASPSPSAQMMDSTQRRVSVSFAEDDAFVRSVTPLDNVAAMSRILDQHQEELTSDDARVQLHKSLRSCSTPLTAARPPETVEEFTAQHFLSHADVCAWLARAPTFDKGILRDVWSFVIRHLAERPSRMERLTTLDQLYQQHLDALELVKKRIREGRSPWPTDDTSALGAPIAASKKDSKWVALAKRGEHPLHTTHRIPQDQFVLETVISRLRMLDEEDRHQGGAIFANGKVDVALKSGRRGTESNIGKARWRDLVPNVTLHQEMAFRQDAALLRHVVKKRAEPHHRSGLEQAVLYWREASPTRREEWLRPLDRTPVVDGTFSGDSTGALQRCQESVAASGYRPVCQETLQNFLSIESVQTVDRRIPLPMQKYLVSSLKATTGSPSPDRRRLE